MHKSSILRMNWFVENYVSGEQKKVLDVGCMDSTGAYRNLFHKKNIQYTGLDICEGPNVDVVMDSEYEWSPLQDESFDYVISGQAFEHIEYPWLTIKEIYIKMKPGGICCIIAPNTSGEHKAPKDCYRYFADGFAALANWAGFIVLDVTVAGIPEENVSPEWDSYDNDVCLIARKPGGNTDNNQIYPKLKYERRMNGLIDQRLRYKFLLKWNQMEDRNVFLSEYFREKSVKRIYIYGYGSIGRLVYRELKLINDIEIIVIDQHVRETETGEVCKKEEDVETESNSAVLITVLDSNRHLKLYLESLYSQMSVFYVDEVFESRIMHEYFAEHENVYIYGAGDYGRMVTDFLEGCGLKPAGFIVSEGHRSKPYFEEYPVIEINELIHTENTGIIVAAGFAIEKEIENTLLEKKLDYIMCDVVGVYSAQGYVRKV